jgi:hypothetical protein
MRVVIVWGREGTPAHPNMRQGCTDLGLASLTHPPQHQAADVVPRAQYGQRRAKLRPVLGSTGADVADGHVVVLQQQLQPVSVR